MQHNLSWKNVLESKLNDLNTKFTIPQTKYAVKQLKFAKNSKLNFKKLKEWHLCKTIHQDYSQNWKRISNSLFSNQFYTATPM